MKKAIDLFNELQEPYRTQALENTREQNLITTDEMFESIQNALGNGFDWSKTEQGSRYWEKLHTLYENEILNERRNGTGERQVQDTLIIDGIIIKIEATIQAESSAKAQNIWNKFRNLNKDILYYER